MFKGLDGFNLNKKRKKKIEKNFDINLVKLNDDWNIEESFDEIEPEQTEKEVQNEKAIVESKNVLPIQKINKEDIPTKISLEEVEKELVDLKLNIYKNSGDSMLPAPLYEPIKFEYKPPPKKEEKIKPKVKTEKAKDIDRKPTFIEVFNKIVEKRIENQPDKGITTDPQKDADRLLEELKVIEKQTRKSLSGYKKYRPLPDTKNFKEPVKQKKKKPPVVEQKISKPPKRKSSKKIPTKEIVVQKKPLLPRVIPLFITGLVLILLGNFINVQSSKPKASSVLGATLQQTDTSEIAYESKGNIWFFKNNNKIQITRDGDTASPYEHIQWIDKNTIGFSRCIGNTCIIYRHNLNKNITYTVTQIETNSINALLWLGLDDFLINKSIDSSKHQIIRYQNDHQTIILSYTDNSKFKTPDDEIGFLKSYDDSFYVFYNTAIEGDENLIIYDIDNNQVAEITENIGVPTITPDNKILFKSQDKLYQAEVDSIFSKVVLDDFRGFDLLLTREGNLLFWTLQDNQIILESIDITNSIVDYVVMNITEPQTDGNVLLGLAPKDSKKDLVIFDKSGRTKLVEENVDNFEVNKLL